MTENVVAGHPVLVCSLEDSMNGRKVKFLVDERREKLIQLTTVLIRRNFGTNRKNFEPNQC